MHLKSIMIDGAVILLSALLLCGCSGGSSSVSAAVNQVGKQTSTDTGSTEGTRDATPAILVPDASGEVRYDNDFAAIDASHTDQGYLMTQYTGTCQKVKLQIIEPDEETTYTYLLKSDGSWETFPITGGSGTYTARILENIEGDSYAIALTQDLDITISDDFLPFLYPNQYVNFTKDSKAIAKGAELAAGASTDLDVVTNIYHYVIKNITYDTAKAENIAYGYLPDIDETLASGTGICFDYASIMTAMLRSQRIPTKLEVGYSGEAYHAWISTYVDDIGWVDNIIEFDGTSWQLMDPTLASNNSAKSVGKYIGDGSNYTLKYSY